MPNMTKCAKKCPFWPLSSHFDQRKISSIWWNSHFTWEYSILGPNLANLAENWPFWPLKKNCFSKNFHPKINSMWWNSHFAWEIYFGAKFGQKCQKMAILTTQWPFWPLKKLFPNYFSPKFHLKPNGAGSIFIHGFSQ